MAVNYISRSNAAALIPDQVSNEIIKNVMQASTFLRLAKPLPRMTNKQMTLPVLTGMAQAGFINGDTGLKSTSNVTWDKVYVHAEEVAVIVPIPESVLDDVNYDIWAEIHSVIEEALGKAIDQAVFFGINKPATWPAGIVTGAISASNTATLYANDSGVQVYNKILGENGVLALVEEKGIAVNGYVGALKMRAKLRGALDNNGQPIFHGGYSNGNTGEFNYDIAGNRVDFPTNGSWSDSTALLLAGDFSMARYAIRQDITYKILDQATLTDADGTATLNLAQQDCVALRAVMRLGWALPKPVNAVSGTSYYPFAVLQPSSDSRVGAINYSVTKPVYNEVAQTTHASGTGYTATIAWDPAPTATKFAGNTEYTATVSYTAASGYIFEDGFGADDVTGLPSIGASGDAWEINVTRVDNTHVNVAVKYHGTDAPLG